MSAGICFTKESIKFKSKCRGGVVDNVSAKKSGYLQKSYNPSLKRFIRLKVLIGPKVSAYLHSEIIIYLSRHLSCLSSNENLT